MSAKKTGLRNFTFGCMYLLCIKKMLSRCFILIILRKLGMVVLCFVAKEGERERGKEREGEMGNTSGAERVGEGKVKIMRERCRQILCRGQQQGLIQQITDIS